MPVVENGVGDEREGIDGYSGAFK
jgi:hypothetical protein